MTVMKKTFLTLIVISTSILFASLLTACRKHHYKACYTVNKTTANIGDTLTFNNCSDYDGVAPSNLYIDWDFGDGTSLDLHTNASQQHKYTATGKYTVTLGVGEKERGDQTTQVITVQ